jgi:hypothetical protein
MIALLQAWLAAWLFALGISLGSLANLMVHTLSGGHWGEPVRAPWRAAARMLPVLAVLFLPVLAGMPWIYPWTEHPGAWLNPWFFTARALAYFAIWIGMSSTFLRAETKPRAAAGLLVHALIVTLAAFDWIASLAPGWRSSGFGLLVGVGQMLAGMSFGIAVAAFGAPHSTAAGAVEERRQDFHDLGNFLMMYVLVWAYLAYTQFLIIWAANLPREIAWYVPRVQTSWMWLALFLVAFHFFIPFTILLARAAKRAPSRLGAIALALLAANFADAVWLVVPSLRPQGFSMGVGDVAAAVVLLASCAVAWRRQWRREARLAHGTAHG